MAAVRKLKAASKYDFVKVKIWVEPDFRHHFILSRFLLSRMLTVTKIPAVKAVRIALSVKKFLVDKDLLDVPQSALEAILFDTMAQFGFREEYVSRYRLVSCFFVMRVPLVVILGGAPCSLKSTLAQALADVMNMPNVQQADLMYELVRDRAHALPGASTAQPHSAGRGATASACFADAGAIWGRSFEGPEAAVRAYQDECLVMRRALDGDLQKVFRDGKPLIIEGMHCDPGLYLAELGVERHASASASVAAVGASAGAVGAMGSRTRGNTSDSVPALDTALPAVAAPASGEAVSDSWHAAGDRAGCFTFGTHVADGPSAGPAFALSDGAPAGLGGCDASSTIARSHSIVSSTCHGGGGGAPRLAVEPAGQLFACECARDAFGSGTHACVMLRGLAAPEAHSIYDAMQVGSVPSTCASASQLAEDFTDGVLGSRSPAGEPACMGGSEGARAAKAENASVGTSLGFLAAWLSQPSSLSPRIGLIHTHSGGLAFCSGEPSVGEVGNIHNTAQGTGGSGRTGVGALAAHTVTVDTSSATILSGDAVPLHDSGADFEGVFDARNAQAGDSCRDLTPERLSKLRARYMEPAVLNTILHGGAEAELISDSRPQTTKVAPSLGGHAEAACSPHAERRSETNTPGVAGHSRPQRAESEGAAEPAACADPATTCAALPPCSTAEALPAHCQHAHGLLGEGHTHTASASCASRGTVCNVPASAAAAQDQQKGGLIVPAESREAEGLLVQHQANRSGPPPEDAAACAAVSSVPAQQSTEGVGHAEHLSDAPLPASPQPPAEPDPWASANLHTQLSRAHAVVAQLAADRGSAPPGTSPRCLPLDLNRLSKALPILVPMVISVAAADAKSLLRAWHRRRLPPSLLLECADKDSPATQQVEFEHLFSFARHLNDYLSSYAEHGVPVYHVNLSNVSAVLEAMHDHVLGSIEMCMGACLDEHQGTGLSPTALQVV